MTRAAGRIKTGGLLTSLTQQRVWILAMRPSELRLAQQRSLFVLCGHRHDWFFKLDLAAAPADDTNVSQVSAAFVGFTLLVPDA